MVELGWNDDWHCSNQPNLQNLQFARNRISYLVDVADLENDTIVVLMLYPSLLPHRMFLRVIRILFL